MSGGDQRQGPRETILRVVLDLLAARGWDGVQMSEVARGARASLARIYALFGTRDELLISALEQWMDTASYDKLAMPAPDESTYAGLLRVFQTVLEPWESNPNLLRAFQRAKVAPGGQRLVIGGFSRVEPAFRAVMAGADPEYVRDVELILLNMAHAVLARVASGDLAVADMLPTLERAVYRLTVDNSGASRGNTGARPR